MLNYYPRWVYSPDENITRANMKQYEKEQNAIYNKCLELNPAFHSLKFKEQYAIKERAEKIIKGVNV